MIYSETIPPKTGETIPVFTDGKPMHSKYNPQSEHFAENAGDGFYVIGGIGGSYHLKSLLDSLGKDSYILAVEADKESLDFSLETGITALVKKDTVLYSLRTKISIAESVSASSVPIIFFSCTEGLGNTRPGCLSADKGRCPGNTIPHKRRFFCTITFWKAMAEEHNPKPQEH